MVCFFMVVKGVICVMILLSGDGGGGGGGGDVGSGESQVPKASLPSRITSSFVRHIPGRRKYDSRAPRKIFTFFNRMFTQRGIFRIFVKVYMR